VNSSTESVAARIDANSKIKLELAAEECGATVSSYLERIIEDHLEENPRELRALNSDTRSDSCESRHTDTGQSADSFIDEMIEELE